ncbi:VanZ family protein [Lachnospiraceae bacterium 54-53]
MKEPLLYLPAGLMYGSMLIACLAALDGVWYLLKKRVLISPFKMICLGLIAAYMYTLLQQTYFSRPPGSRHSVSLILGETWQGSTRGKAYVIENVFMMIPFGFLLPAVLKPAESVFSCIPLGFLFSVCLEYAQFLSQRGHLQADDVVMNVMGTTLGYVLFCIVKFLGRNR